MSDAKRQLEEFRARQFTGPHPALAPGLQPQQQAGATATAAPGGSGAAAAAEQVAPDTGRCVLHLDVDCFYCQAEEVRDPSLRGRPVGVTQKYFVVSAGFRCRWEEAHEQLQVGSACPIASSQVCRCRLPAPC